MRETLARWAAKIASTTLVATALSPLAALPAHAAATTVANNITTADLASVGLTKELLASDIAGTGVTVSNVTYLGDPHQAGRVNITDGSIVSFNKGVIMSSGNIADIVGPNKSESTTGDMLGGQDADLTALIAASQTVYPMTYDAAVLEFDFVP
ncbi:MAG: choice-of-anchor L domain-containing protein, partial [Micrococcales bacterium]